MKPYKVRRSLIDNLGLYATKDIKKGSKIIEYKGKVITRKQAEENPKYDNDKAIYLFNLNKKYDLDGDFKFNTARLINHSCNPNCEVTGTGLRIWVHAIKDIKKGEEFSYDYGFSFDEDFKNYPCKCGSKIAVGLLLERGLDGESKKGRREMKKALFIFPRNPFSGRYSGDVIRAKKFVEFLKSKYEITVITTENYYSLKKVNKITIINFKKENFS